MVDIPSRGSTTLSNARPTNNFIIFVSSKNAPLWISVYSRNLGNREFEELFVAKMGSLLPTAIHIDTSLLTWHHVSSTIILLIFASGLLGAITQLTTRRLKVPIPLSEEIPDVLSRKRSYASTARQILEKYYQNV